MLCASKAYLQHFSVECDKHHSRPKTVQRSLITLHGPKVSLSCRAMALQPDGRHIQLVNSPEAKQYHLSALESFSVTGLDLESFSIKVPLDYSKASGEQISVFFRLATSVGGTPSPKRPYLVYLQGGPGFEGPRPANNQGWLGRAVQYYTVVLLDQRGTGNSTPVTSATLKKLPSVEQQANYLAQFRADNIVRDAEVVRRILAGPEGRWSVLGQSFGGFCAVSYLSRYPEGLAEVFLTGGLPPLTDDPCPAQCVYEKLFRRVATQNRKYYKRFPQDVELVQRLAACLDGMPHGGALLPDGSLLTVEGLQTLGLQNLGTAEGFERLHYLLERAFECDGNLSPVFLAVNQHLPWSTNPLYAVLHESIYCQGKASRWAAESVLDELCDSASSEFNTDNAVQGEAPLYFTGEMILFSMFDNFTSLKPFKEVAHYLAEKGDWAKLYDDGQLQRNRVPVASITYFDDMYVDFDLANQTAGKISNLRLLVTNEYMHSGLREDGAVLLDKLLGMTRNSKVLF